MFRLFLGAIEVTRIQVLLSTNKAILSDIERFEAKKFGHLVLAESVAVCFKGLTGARGLIY